jgi:GT2 family glycosyltransferase
MINRDFFKDKHAIIVVTHMCKPAIVLFMNSILKILDRHPDLVMAVIDSKSSDEIVDYLKSIKHDRIVIEFLEENIGKARAANGFIARYIDESNLPRTVWAIDPDLILDGSSFDYLLEAIQNVDDKIGVLGMRYKKNECNPEKNLWLPPRKIKGKNGKTYRITFPLFCNVAGGILAMKGAVLRDGLRFNLWPKKYIRVYGGDDASLHDELKKQGYQNGYLNGTLVTHLKSGEKRAEELRNLEFAS